MNDDLLEAFVSEARELLEQVAQDIFALESAPDDTGSLERLFRAIHTLKGSAGLVGFAPMSDLFHRAEDRLDGLRRGDAVFDPKLAGALLGAASQAQSWLDELGETGRLPEATTAARSLAESFGAPGPEAAAAPAAIAAVQAAPDWIAALDRPASAAALVAFRYVPAPDSYYLGIDPLAAIAAAPSILSLRLGPRDPFPPLSGYDPFSCNLIFAGLSSAPAAAVREAFRFAAGHVDVVELEQTAAPALAPRASARPRTLRVEGQRIDALGASADELVVTKNALAHLLARATEGAEPGLARALGAAQAELDRGVTRLHQNVTRLRLTPLGPLFRRFPLLVRQIATELSKDVELRISGEGVEVDKSIVDGLFEPLLHLVRNAVDHGIESAEERRAAGKPPRAPLNLSARAIGDSVVIELADDGRGLDVSRIRRTAVERGVADEARVRGLSDDQVADLIFAAGFSTASRVTGVSGRGVGLDAVRAGVAALGGEAHVHSSPGAGARFVLRLPLRVRLARLMLVHAGGEAYGAPLESVIETARLPASVVTRVREGRALVWRDMAVPLLELADLLGLRPPPVPPADLKLIFVRAGEDLVAVAVDRIGERIEAPLRPMTGVLARVPGVSGTTLLGDGRVLMVLDLPELIG
jgi:two-component system chemotaxis sensor kinase CheA